jgi:diguanylate cyclase (GGDEF)-like protein
MDDKNNRVLVIDDNEVIRRLAKTLLTKRNYTVELAKSGPEGIEAAKNLQPQVILLDVMMPDMDGYEVCRRIKADETIRDIPVIMVTSKTEMLDRIKGLEIGAADYIIKPFDQGELLARIATQVKMKNLMEELQEKNKLLEELIKKDGLTELYNHRYFQDRLSEEFSRARRYDFPMSCILLDIDHFKMINDTHGHQAGDEILRSLGRIVMACVRDVDIAARYGGEEFALILPHTKLENSLILAQRLRETVAAHVFKFQATEIKITVSLGAAGIPDNSPSSYSELIRFADEALYRSKELGRNRVESSRTH